MKKNQHIKNRASSWHISQWHRVNGIQLSFFLVHSFFFSLSLTSSYDMVCWLRYSTVRKKPIQIYEMMNYLLRDWIDWCISLKWNCGFVYENPDLFWVTVVHKKQALASNDLIWPLSNQHHECWMFSNVTEFVCDAFCVYCVASMDQITSNLKVFNVFRFDYSIISM